MRSVIALWILTRSLIIIVGLVSPTYVAAVGGDVRQYGAKVERIFQGEAPFANVAVEYPAASLVFMVAPAIAVGPGAGYTRAFAAEMVLLDAAGLWVSVKLAREVDQGRLRIPFAYTVGLAAIGPLLVLRFDLAPALCVLVATLFAVRRRHGTAAAVLGLGAAIKVFPGALLPLLVLDLAAVHGWARALRKTVPPAVIGGVVPLVPALLVSVPGGLAFLTDQVHRGVQVESLWGNLIGLLHDLMGMHAFTRYEYGAYDVIATIAPAFGTLSLVVMALGLVVIGRWVWRRARANGGLPVAQWPAVFALALAAVVIPAKVLSPQYLIWLIVAAAGTAGVKQGRQAMALLVAAAVVTQTVFPDHYPQLLALRLPEVLTLLARNLLLIAAAWRLAVALRALSSQEGRAARRLSHGTAAPVNKTASDTAGTQPRSQQPRSQVSGQECGGLPHATPHAP